MSKICSHDSNTKSNIWKVSVTHIFVYLKVNTENYIFCFCFASKWLFFFFAVRHCWFSVISCSLFLSDVAEFQEIDIESVLCDWNDDALCAVIKTGKWKWDERYRRNISTQVLRNSFTCAFDFNRATHKIKKK